MANLTTGQPSSAPSNTGQGIVRSFTYSQQLAAFMAAIRTVESGSPGGNYGETNALGCKGAYQFCPGTDMYQKASAGGWSVQAQDQVAADQMTAYFNGPAQGNWQYVARAWLGGPGNINNPAASDGSVTVGQYGQRVVGLQQQYMLDESLTGSIPSEAPTSYTSSAGDSCLWTIQQFSIFPGAHVGPFCVIGTSSARALAGAALIGAGGLVMLLGAAVVVANGLAGSKIGRAAAGVTLARRFTRAAPRGPIPESDEDRSMREQGEDARRRQRAYDESKARELGRQEGKRGYRTTSADDLPPF